MNKTSYKPVSPSLFQRSRHCSTLSNRPVNSSACCCNVSPWRNLRLQGHPELSDILADVIRRGQSVAFEGVERNPALRAFPELAPAYDVLDAASKYIR